MTERTRACSSQMKRGHVVWCDEGHRVLGRVEPTVAAEKVQVQSIAVGDVVLAHGGKMASRPAALEPLRWLARFRPAKPIGCRPSGERH